MEYSSKVSYAVGRNGFFDELKGLEILATSDQVILTPIGKSGKVLNAGLSVPLDDIPTLIKELNNIEEQKCPTCGEINAHDPDCNEPFSKKFPELEDKN